MIITETSYYYKKLDYSIKDAETRKNFVNELLTHLSQEQKNNPNYLEILSNYIVSAMTPEEKKNKNILTENRMITINKRETSMENLVNQFENGEDGFWNIALEEADKNVLLTKKKTITKKDLDEIQTLKDLKEGIKIIEKAEKEATGKRRYQLKKWLIEMHQEQYIIKDSCKPVMATAPSSSIKNLTRTNLEETITFDENQEPVSNCLVSFFRPEQISALLCNYSSLKEDCWGHFTWDFWYLMEDLDNLVDLTLKDDYPLYYKLLIYKIDGKSNLEIQNLLMQEFNITYTGEYISHLWRNKIPKLIAEKAKEQYILWYYTYKEKGKWKTCSKCGKTKLAHNRFFSKNGTAKDGWYSICKECRNKRHKEGEY